MLSLRFYFVFKLFKFLGSSKLKHIMNFFFKYIGTIIDMNTICRLCYKDFKDVLMSKDVDDSLNASLKFKVQKLLPFIDVSKVIKHSYAFYYI